MGLHMRRNVGLGATVKLNPTSLTQGLNPSINPPPLTVHQFRQSGAVCRVNVEVCKVLKDGGIQGLIVYFRSHGYGGGAGIARLLL